MARFSRVPQRSPDEARRGERLRRLAEDDHRTTLSAEATRDLEHALRRRVRGEVRFDDGTRALYATDASNYRQAPIGVVLPLDAEDVVQAFAAARELGAPILSRGGGTSLAGQCCNVAVVLDYTKYMHRVVRVDPERRLATVQPGCVLDDLRRAAAPYGLTFGPDPATHSHCTLGGMIGNNSCGVHSLLSVNAGLGMRTSDNTDALEILTYQGDRMRVGRTPDAELERVIAAGGARGALHARLRAFRDRHADAIRHGFARLPRRVSGYNIDELLPENDFHLARALVGSEATLVAVLEATVHLVPAPAARSLLVLGYPDVFEAGDHVMEIRAFAPIGLEGIDHILFQMVRDKGDQSASLDLLPKGRGFLLAEFGGDDAADAHDRALRCMHALAKQPNPPAMRLVDDPRERDRIWKVREGGLGSTAWVKGRPDSWPGWEDSAVPPERVGVYLRDLRALFAKYDLHPSLYGHLGQGCVHCRVGFDLYTRRGVDSYRAFVEEAADLAVRYGGSLSGEHGDGQARGELLARMFGPEMMDAFRDLKGIFDPRGKMNPGKLIDAYPLDVNLRVGPDYDPPAPATHFRFRAEGGSFARAALRCVGAGNCRQHEGGVMCPSYMVTREEQHSTRGRARLLWEMLNGEVLSRGWRSPAVKRALDLCLACKGCKRECPVNVDMASYKAEFIAHYYEGRVRPRQAYAMGWIRRWAGLAAHAPWLANAMTQTPGLRGVAKLIGGLAPQRPLPKFARQTFKQWWRARDARPADGRPVILWADTFHDSFFPEVARAAALVLEAAGFSVTVPEQPLCCGRPLYDFGMLDEARRSLRQILDALRNEIGAGVPVVGLEPSCIAVFRDEMLNLLPEDPIARRLHDQSFLLGELLARHAPGYRPPRLEGRALVHFHCHQRAVLDTEDELALLRATGLELEVPETGCCGLAGSFGYQKGAPYDVSMACGERVLFPAVRGASDDTLVVTNGFSCHQQIAHGTGRRALHLAEVLRMGMDTLTAR